MLLLEYKERWLTLLQGRMIPCSEFSWPLVFLQSLTFSPYPLTIYCAFWNTWPQTRSLPRP